MENFLPPTSFEYDRLVQVHIELTNKCNAACPMCARFHKNSPLLRTDLVLGEISIEQFKEWFPPELVKKLKMFLFCGTHGDPCMAKDLIEIVEYIRDSSNGESTIRIHTNGGMKTPDWWEKLGQVLQYKNVNLLTFSIDGLEDTNHVYRRNVIWSRLIENVKAFTATGANAAWDYLIFKHNEHQIEEARQLALDLNFKHFVPKKALGVDNGEYLVPMVATNIQGEVDYVIEAPTDPKNRNLENPKGSLSSPYNYRFTKDVYNEMRSSKKIIEFYKKETATAYDRLSASTKDYSKENACEIQCKSFKGDNGSGVEVFIDYNGNVLPCCFVGTRINSHFSDDATLQLQHDVKKHGYEKFNLNHTTIKELLDSKLFDNIFTDSWKKNSILEGKLLYCSEVCGEFSAIDRILTHEKTEKLK